MYSSKIWVILATIIIQIYGASKYYDGEIRPYEFGYNIEGNQHRHESKDEKGIIMGEFGFITADGVYHVTAYATDENGNFKILFMKNIKIGLPGDPKTKTLPLPKKPPTRMAKKLKQRKSGDTRACSGCAIPNPKVGNEDGVKPENRINEIGRTNSGTPLFRPLSKKLENSSPRFKNSLLKSQQIPGRTQKTPGKNIQYRDPQILSKDRNQNPQEIIHGGQLPSDQSTNPRPQPDRKTKSLKPATVVDRKSLNDMRKMLAGILYKFNYTVGYHGHNEKGDFIGSKDGGYFFTGRDGLRRDVEYVANEFGYQPYLTQEKAKDGDVPNEDTEKEAGLKGFEFKWFNEEN